MITLDTNIYVSALRYGGKPAELLGIALKREVQVPISQPILDETLRVLRDKFKMPLDRLREAEATIRSCTVMVEPKMQLKVIREDEPDNRILECAVESGSETIVTGDKDLRRGEFEGIRMLRVGEFLAKGRER